MSEFDNTSGVMMEQENAADAAQLAPETEPENDGEAFSAFADTEPETQEEPQAQEAPAKEPGWIKGRVDKAVQKAVRETESRMRAEYEKKLAPLYARMMDEQAQQLVKDGEFKSIERAREYVRLKGGVQPEETANTQQAEPAQQAEQTNPHLVMLAKQADRFAAQGIDVMSVFRSDERIRNAVLSGQMDFYDVAEQIGKPKRVPSAVRSANNASAGGMDIRNMTDAQFQRLQRDLAAGKKFDLRR